MAYFRVKEICKERGIHLKEIAQRIGVSPSSLSQSLNNKNASLATLERIADCLDVDITELFERKKPTINGSVFIGNTLYSISRVDDLVKVLKIAEEKGCQ